MPSRTPARSPLGYARKPTLRKFFWDIRRPVPRLQKRKSWDIIQTIWDIKRLFLGHYWTFYCTVIYCNCVTAKKPVAKGAPVVEGALGSGGPFIPVGISFCKKIIRFLATKYPPNFLHGIVFDMVQ